MKEFLYGVVDRVSGERAVILIDEHNKEIVVDVQDLPFEVNEGDWLTLELNDNYEIVYCKKNEKITTIHAENVDSVLKRLKAIKGSKFKN